MIGISSTNVMPGDRYLPSLMAEFPIVEFNHRYLPLAWDSRYIDRILNQVREYGTRLFLHSGVTNLGHEHPLIREQQVLLLQAEVVFAKQVGVEIITFHLPKLSDVTNQWAQLKEILDRVVYFAKDEGIKLLVENDSRGLWTSPRPFMALIKEYPSLNMCLDLGHLNIALNKRLVSTEMAFIERLGPKINLVHVHDNNGELDQHKTLGTGTLQYHSIILKLKEIGVQDWVIETHNLGDARSTRQILNDHGIR